MGPTEDIVATRREALDMLGIRETSLTAVESAAGIASNPRRRGYTTEELRRLVDEVRRALGR